MSNTLFDKLCEELDRAKKENPVLDKDANEKTPSKLLDTSINNSKHGFYHGSHNSHGDWSKHWAHGSYEDDEPTDTESNIPSPK